MIKSPPVIGIIMNEEAYDGSLAYVLYTVGK